MFINPRVAEMKNRAPLMEHFGHPVEERVILPAAYVISLAFRERDSKPVRDGVQRILDPSRVEILSERIAHYEWEQRFKLMVVKRLGPSLVPAEVIIPLSSLGEVMEEIESKVDQPVVKESVLVDRGRGTSPRSRFSGLSPATSASLATTLSSR